jgi:hypothetical protein
MYGGTEIMWKEVAVAYLKVLIKSFSRETEEIPNKRDSG